MHLSIIAIIMAAMSAAASTDGVNAVVTRRQGMKPLERRVIAQRMEDGVMLSAYDDGTTGTAAVSVVRMAPATQARVAQLIDDQESLAAGRALAARVRAAHADKAATLPDAAILATAEQVLDTTTRDAGAAGAIGAALGAAAAAAAATAKKKGQS